MYALSFGRLEVAFDPADLVWGDLKLTEFAAAAEFRVRGLRNRYRRPGLGAPLALLILFDFAPARVMALMASEKATGARIERAR